MVKIDNNFHNQPNQDTNPATNQQAQPAPNQQSGLMTIIGQLLPLAPFAFEQFTGQKVPQMTGTIAEMKMSLLQIQSALQTIVNNQTSLNQRLITLETNANQHLTNLNQAFQSLRLTHTKEQKRIEYNPPQLEEESQNY